MAHDALEVVKERRNFYRDSYRAVISILFIAILAIVILSGILIYMMSHKPSPTYFATTSGGRLIKMIPLDQPNMSQSAIRSWMSTAVTSLYTYDFLNYRKTFQENSQYFTKSGWKAFLSNLEKSRNLKTVQEKKLVVQAVPAGAGVIVNEGVLRGKFSWRIQMPIVVTYTSLSEQFSQQLMITVTVQRLPTLDSKYGVGIAQLVEQQRS